MRARLALLILSVSILACAKTVSTVSPAAPSLQPADTASPQPTPPAPAATSVSIDTVRRATIVKPTVNVRSSPASAEGEPAGPVTGSLSAGDIVRVISCSRFYCKVSSSGIDTGYIWRGCLSDNPERLGCEAR